jgi:transposase
MELMTSLFEKALNLEHPWTVKNIDFDMDRGALTIVIDFPRGSPLPLPEMWNVL